MTSLIKLPNDHLAVIVPEGANNFSMGFNDPTRLYYYPKDRHNSFDHRSIQLEDSYTIVGLGSEISEEQAGSIVESVAPAVCKDYMSSKYCDNYLESFQSLLRSLSLDISNVLIVKQNK